MILLIMIYIMKTLSLKKLDDPIEIGYDSDNTIIDFGSSHIKIDGSDYGRIYVKVISIIHKFLGNMISFKFLGFTVEAIDIETKRFRAKKY